MDYEKTLAHFKIKSRQDNKIQAFCPAHDDKNASLSILVTEDNILLHCFAGCKIDDVMKSAGITYADLFPEKPPAAIYQYRNEDGSFAYEKLKYKTPDGKKTFKQRRIDGNTIAYNLTGVKRIPYNYPAVLQAIKQGATILYVEGEKDAETARLFGYVATTMGGASDWKDNYKTYFQNAIIVQIPDKDDAGITLAQNATKSLTEVCKSLKVCILPSGKDLTEWIELGNKDIPSLIKDCQELVAYKGIPDPIMTKNLSGYSFTWNDLNLIVQIDRLNDEAEGIIIVKDLTTGRTLHTSKINLLSTRSLSELANRLSKSKKVEWNTILSVITNLCFNTLQDGGETVNIDEEPKTMRVEYLLEPLIPINEPVTIYTAGGKGKSIFADYIAVLVQYGVIPSSNLPFVPRGQANVLYLDWEADEETHRRYITAIKRGLRITDNTFIAYRRIEYPLAQVIDSIRTEIIKRNIELVIIDSQMAATASGTRGLTEAQVASEYYNLIRSFHCSTLTIDHITKQGMISSDGSEAPYGSVVKYNRSRSQFELRLPDDEDDSDHKEYALIHRKFNLGRKQKPLGIAVDFSNNGNDELAKIEYNTCKLADNPSLEKVLPLKDRIKSLLLVRGQLTTVTIADQLSANEASIKTVLNRYKSTLFSKYGDTWGVLTSNNEIEQL